MNAEPALAAEPAGVQLIAGFDEYFIGYRDRFDVIAGAHIGRITPGNNGIFAPCVLRDGEVVGVWKRASTPKKVSVSLSSFDSVALDPAAVDSAVAEYAAFLGLPYDVRMVP